MQGITQSPWKSLAAGLAISAAMLAGWVIANGADAIGLVSFVLRWAHVVLAIIWVGLVWFVNFIQIVVLQSVDDAGRPVILKWIVPRVAYWFRHASTWTVVTGVLLMVATGYLLPQVVYGSGVFLPTARIVLLWVGTVGALVMWMFVHMYIWPNLQVVLGERPGDAAAKAAARERVHFYARLNLLLSIPVTLAMVGAPHLF